MVGFRWFGWTVVLVGLICLDYFGVLCFVEFFIACDL